MRSHKWIHILFAAATLHGLALGPLAVAQVGNGYRPAFTRGYREGFRDGRQDVQAQRPYNFTRTPIYPAADLGYDVQRFPSRENYACNFRQGYEAGYDDGYNHREESSRRDVPRTYTYRGKDEIWSSTDHHRRELENVRFVEGGTFVLPEKTLLYLRLNNTLSARSSQPGDAFTAQVIQSVYVDDALAIPIGSTVQGTVTRAANPAAPGQAQMRLRLATLILPSDRTYKLNMESVDQRPGSNSLLQSRSGPPSPSAAEREFGKITIGSGPGALVGTLVGNSGQAMIGTELKAGSGLDAVLVARGDNLDLPPGKEITIRLSRPVELER